MSAVLLAPLTAWFRKVRRPFPWREDPTPYRVFVSEVMLQQTQASRVVPFFIRWMELFPTVCVLAEASEESVVKAWEGLGYYSRARSLHAASKVIVERHEGVIPQEESDLLALPGVGPYTAGAVRAFAFHKRAAAIDANVRRVVSRLLGEGDPDSLAVEKLLPVRRPWEAMEALIELGALVCKPVPDCDGCPLADRCLRTQETVKRRRPSRTKVWRDVAVLLHDDRIFVALRGGGEVMSGLYEFPYYETNPGGRTLEQLMAWIEPVVQTSLHPLGSIPSTTHAFTRFFATLYPAVFRCSVRPDLDGRWVTLQEAVDLPFSSGHRRVLHAFRDRSAIIFSAPALLRSL